MKRVTEFGLFVMLAAGAHIAVASYAPGPEGAQGIGDDGTAAVSLQASDARIAQMVAAWETPPEVAGQPAAPPAPRMAMSAPEISRPQAAPSPFTKAPTAPGLAVPRPERLPEHGGPDTSPPRPAQPGPEPGPAQQAEKQAGVRPVARPEAPAAKRRRAAPTQGTRAQRSASAPSAPQKARGQGGGADAGTAQDQRAATLSASRRQSLAAQWGAQVRRRIEQSKRYPR
uniref:hypothetical protein n=1 Tax=Roseovarius halophilus (ex Wu et al. 2025) TaxID=3376060 RepID=UPI00399C14C6